MKNAMKNHETPRLRGCSKLSDAAQAPAMAGAEGEEAPAQLTAGGLDVVEPAACEEPRFPGEEQLFEDSESFRGEIHAI